MAQAFPCPWPECTVRARWEGGCSKHRAQLAVAEREARLSELEVTVNELEKRLAGMEDVVVAARESVEDCFASLADELKAAGKREGEPPELGRPRRKLPTPPLKKPSSS
jgi:uncharacterized coiled-coil protein SlyX